MVAVASEVRFYVDESAAGLGLALCAARKDTIYVGHPLIPECPRGALDTEWIPAVANRNLVVIARDKKLRTKPVEIQTLWDAGLRVFNIGGKKDQSTWEWLGRVVKYWPRMEDIVEERPVGPWIYMINEAGLEEYRPGDDRREVSVSPPKPRRPKPTTQPSLFERGV
ncbi:hypothetical protein [Mycolicibacterium sp. P1-18]|uniref:PIN-like domain-containing protein n=1 Tax=Mycolicibacterium sp. P1-18 TaxID=2024615 RepID=UPI0011F28039|nr:hypothetical protein [Mycolicibacterium sp. P1-18]